ncbi:putative methionine aminopeptidase type 1 [Atractiella rhizophila]|nr:putative methionine aminopeptidase type 1 [Atractiella rhizophila]
MSAEAAVPVACPGFNTPKCKGLVPDQEEGTRCSVCLKQGNTSRWCSKECFVDNCPKHKSQHKLHDPYTKKTYTGSLRASFPSNMRNIPADIPLRHVPAHIPRPDYAATGESKLEYAARMKPPVALDEAGIEAMKTVGRLTREVLDIAAAAIRPGITTLEIDEIVHEEAIKRNAYPSPLNYGFFPRSVCTSVNEVICHGIPDCRPLEKEDIINLDVSLFYNGYHADLNATYPVDPAHTPPESLRLIKASRECLDQAIAICKPGVPYREVGKVIEKTADRHGMGTVRKYIGHGVNTLYHAIPDVPHYAANKAPYVMKPGHTFTIEPMITLGDYRDRHWPDNWTSVTRDGKHSAQWEETLLITEDGVEVLTAANGWKWGDGWKTEE